MTQAESGDAPFNMDAITKQAARAAEKASAKPVALEDRGIHLSPADREDIELRKAGFESVALHPHSFVWMKNGRKYPRSYALEMARQKV